MLVLSFDLSSLLRQCLFLVIVCLNIFYYFKRLIIQATYSLYKDRDALKLLFKYSDRLYVSRMRKHIYNADVSHSITVLVDHNSSISR